MKAVHALGLAALLAGAIAAVPALADEIYLQADFDNKPVGEPIGTGGAAMGEPVSVDPRVTAIVRDTPLPTPCLEIADNHDYAAGVAAFELLGSIELTTGITAITCTLWFEQIGDGCEFLIYVREQGSSAHDFASVRFKDSGTVSAFDAEGSLGTIGAYEAGRQLPLAIVLDMDAGTYDIWLDDTLLVDDETHGITDHGVGSVKWGCSGDSDLEGRFYVDDILVSDTFTPAPVTPARWGGVKALFR
jgi:hypothetical protein